MLIVDSFLFLERDVITSLVSLSLSLSPYTAAAYNDGNQLHFLLQ